MVYCAVYVNAVTACNNWVYIHHPYIPVHAPYEDSIYICNHHADCSLHLTLVSGLVISDTLW